MATKLAARNESAPDLRSVFNWVVKISDFDELFLLAGRGDVAQDGQIRNPGDPVAQTVSILAELKDFIERNDYALNDVTRIEFTMSRDVDRAQQQAIFGKFARFFEEVVVKPAAGTLRASPILTRSRRVRRSCVVTGT